MNFHPKLKTYSIKLQNSKIRWSCKWFPYELNNQKISCIFNLISKKKGLDQTDILTITQSNLLFTLLFIYWTRATTDYPTINSCICSSHSGLHGACGLSQKLQVQGKEQSRMGYQPNISEHACARARTHLSINNSPHHIFRLCWETGQPRGNPTTTQEKRANFTHRFKCQAHRSVATVLTIMPPATDHIF